VEKQQLMRALGAEVVNTPSEDGMGFAIDRAHEIADELDDAVVPQQFSNPLNAEAHYETTAPRSTRRSTGRWAPWSPAAAPAGR